MSFNKKPLFSIGITTYNRKGMLKQLVDSILIQDFQDFEIIIGNDYQKEPLSQETLGLSDSRIKIINHPENLGERKNMNYLLEMATGKYFTWQFDDDLCAPNFLLEIATSLKQFEFPKCILTSFKFIYGTSEVNLEKAPKVEPQLFTGKECLRKYLSGMLRLSSLAGFYDTEYLKGLGGAKKLSSGHMALYAEFFLMVEVGLLPKVVYLKSPLTLNRVHGTSFSSTGSAVELHKEAGINLIKESMSILANPILQDEFYKNMTSFYNSVICAVIVKAGWKEQKISKAEIRTYISSLKSELETLKNPILIKEANEALDKAVSNIVFFKMKAWIKSIIPVEKLKLVRTILSVISPYTNKSF